MRFDIQYLRAIAVIAVLFFHFEIPPFDGGFLGVDAFFVISGFVITKNIQRLYFEGKFKYSVFIRRRVTRLFPALYVTILGSVVGSYFFLPVYATETFTGSAAAAALALSNMFFYMNLDYFSVDAQLQPLLHTWSLGVEEQFYLVWPSLMVLTLGFFGRRGMLILIISTSIISIVAAEAWLSRDVSATFYLLPFRVFEFGLGALIVFIPTVDITLRLRQFLFYGLVSGMVTSFIVLDKSTPMPGVISLYPLSMTAAAIWIGIPNGKKNRFLAAIGDSSYSIYLVHWPIAIFMGDQQNYTYAMIGICSSMLFGYLMYQFVENPIRHSNGVGASINRNILKYSVLMISIILALSITSFWSQGWMFRTNEIKAHYLSFIGYDGELQYAKGTCFLSENYGKLDTYIKNNCIHFEDTGADLLLIGDSIAAQFSKGLKKWALQNGFTFSQVTASSCQFIEENPKIPLCHDLVEELIDHLSGSTKYETILVAGNYYDHASIRHRYAMALAQIVKPGRNVLVLGPSPRYDQPLPVLLGEYSNKLGEIEPQIFDHLSPSIFEHDKSMAKALSDIDVSYISFVDALCDLQSGRCEVLLEDVPIHRDQIHLTESGANYLVHKMLSPKLKAE